MLFPNRLKLFACLRGHHVVVAVKVQNPIAGSVGAQKARGRIVWGAGRPDALAIQAHTAHVAFEEVNASAVIPAGRIFRGNRDEFGQDRRHLVLTAVQPGEYGLRLAGSVSMKPAHSPES
jgi:hypothetical protein